MRYRLFIAVAVAGLILSAPAKVARAVENGTDTYRLLNLLGDVFERVRADYVEDPTDQELIESAITGMLVSLDPHSSYLNAKSFREMQVQTRGEFGGLGIEVTMENGLVKVVSPIDDTPAFRAGIEPGDLITHLNGEPVLGLALSEAVEKMRGPVGSDLKITIRRQGRDPFDVSITRAVIKITSVRSRLEGDIGYLRITSFNERTDTGVTKAMDAFDKELGEKLRGIVLDLRNNPGGLLDQAISVSDAFLDKGEIVSTRARRNEDTQRYNARPGDLAKGLPIVVLTNGGSASASEIVAGALQDHRRAIILGTKSFGKGSVQTIIPLPGHGAMRLTTARYYTPSGRSIQSVGIEPDIEVKQARIEAIEPASRRRESDLRGALPNDVDKDSPEKPGAADAQPPVKPEDYQLARALDLINGVAMFSTRLAE
ncbi:MAG: S41 family peptidase [Rhodospirillales bacterium]|jgi:carboxyl-terminal processing protease|nr:S41 family peptidase [Rhodospirillales bacterium]